MRGAESPFAPWESHPGILSWMPEISSGTLRQNADIPLGHCTSLTCVGTVSVGAEGGFP